MTRRELGVLWADGATRWGDWTRRMQELREIIESGMVTRRQFYESMGMEYIAEDDE